MTLTFSGTLLPLASNVCDEQDVLRPLPSGPNVSAVACPSVAGTFAGLAIAMQFCGIDRCQDTRNSPRVGIRHGRRSRCGLDEVTCPSALICAQSAICPAIDLGSRLAAVTAPFASLRLVTAPLRSCLVPTLPAGRLSAAYDVPPERDEQGEQSDGVVADEGEGLEHWTYVSLLGASGASAWAKAAVLAESRLALVRRTCCLSPQRPCWSRAESLTQPSSSSCCTRGWKSPATSRRGRHGRMGDQVVPC